MIKWVVRLAFITALLGIVGTILILTNLSPKKQEKEIRRDERKDTTSDALPIDTQISTPQPKLPPAPEDKPTVVEKESPVVIENRQPVVAEKPKPMVVEKKEEVKPKAPVPNKESEEKLRALLAKKEENKKKQAKIEALKKAEKKELAKKEALKKAEKKELAEREAEEKLFTQGELQQIVVRINAVKEENDIYSNCVQMHITRRGNNSRTISQVETYLRSQRFAIAGREVIERKVKGIQISPTANCVRITIGTF